MDNLLCFEEWPAIASSLSSANLEPPSSFFTNKEDHKDAIRVCMTKELSFMPEPGYMEQLVSDDFLIGTRLKAIELFIKCQRRLDLSIGTVFVAVNCLDRFISLHMCTDWRLWMMELLSIACLSIASKFVDTSPPTIHEIQVEGVKCSFERTTIQQMEVILLKALQWQISSSTVYSYIELLMYDVEDFHTIKDCLTEILLTTLTDMKVLQFRPWTIAISAIKHVVEELRPLKSTRLLDSVINLTPVDSEQLQVDLIKCEMIIKARLSGLYWSFSNQHPSSPVTVLRCHCTKDCQCSSHPRLPEQPCFNINLEFGQTKRKRENT